MRNVQCPGCKKTLRVHDAEAEKTAKCPACGKQLRIPPSKRTEAANSTNDSWSIRDIDGNEFGPYTLEEIAALIAEQRIISTTEIHHPVFTKGEWTLAARIAKIDSLLAAAPVDILAPPVAPPVATDGYSADTVEGGFFPNGNRIKGRLVQTSRSSSLQFWIDFLDPTFQRYVTPTVVMITWWAVLVFTAISLVVVIVNLVFYMVPEELLVEQEVDMRPPRRAAPPSMVIPESFRKLISAPLIGAMQFVGACLGLLWMRVVLEICVVVFHIAQSLKAIQSNADDYVKRG